VYTINSDEILDFVKQIAPGEPCGITNDPDNCLVALALRHKYWKPFVVAASSYWPWHEEDAYVVPLEPEIVNAIREFDSIAPKNKMAPVTKEVAKQFVTILGGLS
jgi:hypothetical protein